MCEFRAVKNYVLIKDAKNVVTVEMALITNLRVKESRKIPKYCEKRGLETKFYGGPDNSKKMFLGQEKT